MRAPHLYLHFPFCETKCHYCDFYSIGRERTQTGDAPTFENALSREIDLRGEQGAFAPETATIFMGGGTPSMTPPTQMARAIAPLWKHTRLASDYEWTMEANPSSVTREALAAYRDLGVNRVSMGVQAMRDDLLARLGRVHSRDAALRALDAIFAAGFDNCSVDLLCGVPGQSLQDLEEAMATLSAYPITHLSCYLLTLPKTHRMAQELPSEEVQLDHLLLIDSFMGARGFEHYEISNFAKPGRRARHNLAYWTGASYLGLGPSAHSFDASAGTRFKNISALHPYADRLARGELPVEWTEQLNAEQRELEKWMLALRLAEGFPEAWLDTNLRRARAERLVGAGLLTRVSGGVDTNANNEASRLRLTARGFALSDPVIAELASG